MQTSSIGREKWLATAKEKADKAATDISAAAKRGGLSDEAVQAIRRQILGIVDPEDEEA